MLKIHDFYTNLVILGHWGSGNNVNTHCPSGIAFSLGCGHLAVQTYLVPHVVEKKPLPRYCRYRPQLPLPQQQQLTCPGSLDTWESSFSSFIGCRPALPPVFHWLVQQPLAKAIGLRLVPASMGNALFVAAASHWLVCLRAGLYHWLFLKSPGRDWLAGAEPRPADGVFGLARCWRSRGMRSRCRLTVAQSGCGSLVPWQRARPLRAAEAPALPSRGAAPAASAPRCRLG